jgi:hypothetical protein
MKARMLPHFGERYRTEQPPETVGSTQFEFVLASAAKERTADRLHDILGADALLQSRDHTALGQSLETGAVTFPKFLNDLLLTHGKPLHPDH